nr:LysR family transcriptional regulator [Candidatus Ozemobacteraceae bacterium]
MDFRLLRYFVAVADQANFSRAAETVHLTQPALSQAIRALEKDLGCVLFDRGRGVRLTPAGERLREHCRQLLPHLQDIRDDLAELHGGLQGTIRPAVLESLLLYLLPPVISRFSSIYPLVKFDFRMQETRDIESSVLSGDCHFGLVSRPPMSRALECQLLETHPHVLVTASANRAPTSQLLQKLPLYLLGDWQAAALEEH